MECDDESKTDKQVTRSVEWYELQAAIPGAEDEFRDRCIEKGLTVGQAQDEYIAHLLAENERLRARASKPGVTPLTSSTRRTGQHDGQAAAE